MEPHVGNKFRLVRKICSGSFGEIYLGTNIQTDEEVAIKLEEVKTKHPQLRNESKVYKMLQGGTGVPNVIWFGIEGDYNILVLDLLGPNLEDLFNFCSRKFSLKTVLMLADQMINHVEFIHTKSFLHRDIRPDNFLMGLGRRVNQVYAIDFGLAKKYRDSSTHKHIPYRENKNLTGTAMYASTHTHFGIEQSRRDDLESLGYVLMYFLRGSLPWQGLKAENKKQKYEKISEKKFSTSIESLCRGCPTEFASYFHYCGSLRFDDKPDYAYLKRIFRDLFIREDFQFDFVYDWTILKYQQSQLANPPSHALGAGVGAGAETSSGIPPIAADPKKITEMNLLKILKKPNRGMEFVAVESSMSLPSPPEGILPSSPADSPVEDILSADDNITPLAAIVKRRGDVSHIVPESVNPPHAAVSLPKQKKPCSPSLFDIDEDLEEPSSLCRKDTEKLPSLDHVPEMSSPVIDENVSAVFQTSQSSAAAGVSPEQSLPTKGLVTATVLGDSTVMPVPSLFISEGLAMDPMLSESADFSVGEKNASIQDLDSVSLVRKFCASLHENYSQGLEIVNRLQHRSDVALRLQQKIASLEDELTKVLEEKKQLLGEVLDVEASRAESRRLGEELKVTVDKLKASESRVTALDEEVEKHAHELQCQQIVMDGYMDDSDRKEEEVRKLTETVEMAHEFLEDKRLELEKAQEDVLLSRVEVARLSNENQGLRAEVQQLAAANRELSADRRWLITQGFHRVFERIKGSNEYVCLFGEVNSACLAVGYQNGLCAGYKYSSQGVSLEESPYFNPSAEQWMMDSSHALESYSHSLLTHLAASPGISIADIQSLTAVVEPSTPGP
ncbi:hypothetical protein R6Q59_013018 [Mikania micrantha]